MEYVLTILVKCLGYKDEKYIPKERGNFSNALKFYDLQGDSLLSGDIMQIAIRESIICVMSFKDMSLRSLSLSYQKKDRLGQQSPFLKVVSYQRVLEIASSDNTCNCQKAIIIFWYDEDKDIKDTFLLDTAHKGRSHGCGMQTGETNKAG